MMQRPIADLPVRIRISIMRLEGGSEIGTHMRGEVLAQR